MKKLLLLILLSFVSVAQADPHRHGHHHGGGWGYNWVAPAIIGGIITYELTRPPQPQTVVIQQPPVVTTYPTPPFGYHYENILDANCRCYRLVLVQN